MPVTLNTFIWFKIKPNLYFLALSCLPIATIFAVIYYYYLSYQFYHFIRQQMKQQKGQKIVLSKPLPNAYLFPTVPTHHTHNHVQPSINPKRFRRSKEHENMQSLDEICLRECCKRKQQIYRKSVAEASAKKQHFLGVKHHHPHTPIAFNNHPKRKNLYLGHSKKRTLTYQNQPRSKEKIYYLHNLKKFELQGLEQPQHSDLQERQTEHKIRNDQRQTRLLQWRDNFKKEHIGLIPHARSGQKQLLPALQRKNEYRARNDSYIQTDLVTSRSNHQQVVKSYKEREEDAKTSPTKRYYKYIQNYQNSEDNQGYPQHKTMNSQNEEERKSVQSYFKPTSRRENSTIFHTNKLKFSNSVKESRVDSSKIISQRLEFAIPKTQEEQTQYLLKYKPLDKNFNLKAIVAKQNFKILQKEDMIYFGLVKNGQKSGLGIFLTEKECFQGEFIEDEKSRGIEKTKQGVYSGSFVNGKREGNGKFTWANGQEFEGQWKKGKKEGHGIWTSPKGDFYEGDWKSNKQNGKGLFTHVGGSKYSGYYKDFLKHGRGEQEFANGDKYIGEYKYGKPHGFGRYIWANGDKYEGEFVQGSREGRGLLKKASGESYQGGFANDMKQGQGKQRYASGQYFQGQFYEDGKLKGKLFDKKGVVIEQIVQA